MREKIVVSLSTIPPRFNEVGAALRCILNQNRRADEIHLYIPQQYRRFPEHAFCLPAVPEGVSIKVVEDDLGPATKILPCAKAHWGTNTRIVYCDDDRLPPKNWLGALLAASERRPDDAVVSSGDLFDRYGISVSFYKRNPRAIPRSRRSDLRYYAARLRQFAHSAITLSKQQKPARHPFRQSGYIAFAHGLGGVSIRPEFLGADDFMIPNILWTVDDIWLSGAFERKGIGIWAEKTVPMPAFGSAAQHSSLAESVIEAHDRSDADLACIKYLQEHYGIWL